MELMGFPDVSRHTGKQAQVSIFAHLPASQVEAKTEYHVPNALIFLVDALHGIFWTEFMRI